MATRVLGPTGSRRRRRFLFVPILLVAAVALLLVGAAQAVHDENFQLDGDVIASTTTNVGGTTQAVDWNSLFDASGGEIDPQPAGFTDNPSFDKDFTLKANGSFNPADNDIFTTGSKDELPISGWQCKASNNVTDKNDIMNAYATAFTAANGDKILYFALEKNDNTGTQDVGFWFLQDGTVACDGSQGTATFSGAHVDGDLLVVSEFTQGGVVSTIKVYRWNGGANGSLDVANPIAEGVDCESTNPNDEACATVNRPPDGTTGNGTITTPWPTSNKSDGPGNSLRTGEFFEGGLNLSANNLADRCFNTFLADTRASSSTTSDLEDFSLGTLGGCLSDTVTTPTPAAGTETQIPANAQVTSSDSAEITVTNVSQFSGTVTFSLCGPLALNSTANCQTGGVQISSHTLTNVTSPHTVQSSSVTLTAVGKYCWRAVYSGDPAKQVPGSSDPDDATNQSECFRITPRTPTLTTCAGTYNPDGSCTPTGAVNFGSAVTDRANLTGTANRPGTGGLGDGSINPTGGNGPAQGTITFRLFGPNSCTTLAAGFPAAGLTASVNGDGVYGPVTFTPQAPGTYHWKASYGGDPPNTNSDDHNADCTDANEDVIVRQVKPILSTRQFVYPQDKAKITCSPVGDCSSSGTGNLSGSVSFKLYDTLANCQANGSAGLLFGPQSFTISGPAPQTATTNNTSAAVTAGTTVFWRVTYTSANQAQTDADPSACTEQTTVSFVGDDATITVP